MGKTKIRKTSTLTNSQNEALNSIMKQSAQDTNYIADYLKNIVENGPDSHRVQQAVTNYKQQILPQMLGALGEGRSSSALNQALSQGGQDLATNLAGDSMQALQMLQQLTQGNAATGLGTQAQALYAGPSTLTQVLSGLAQLTGMGAGFLGQNNMLGSLGSAWNTMQGLFSNIFKKSKPQVTAAQQ